MRRSASLLFFALALASCSELRWQKAGGDETALAEALTACRNLARRNAIRTGNLGLPPASDPRFGPPSGPTQAEQVLQERQAADACMRQRGYVLVPA